MHSIRFNGMQIVVIPEVLCSRAKAKPPRYEVKVIHSTCICILFENLFSTIDSSKKTRKFVCQEFVNKNSTGEREKKFRQHATISLFLLVFFNILNWRRKTTALSHRQRVEQFGKAFFLSQFLCYTLFNLFFHRRMRIFLLSPEQLWQLTPDFGFISFPCVQRTQYIETGNFLCTQYSCYSCGN